MTENLTSAAACPFCDRFAGRTAPLTRQLEAYTIPAVTIIEPLNPVTEGHALVLPRAHVTTLTDPLATNALHIAGEYGERLDQDFNLIVNRGPAATQTMEHLHIHVVPRLADDGLALPWAGFGWAT